MAKDLVTADAVNQAILHRIATARISSGVRLPPVIQLAGAHGKLYFQIRAQQLHLR